MVIEMHSMIEANPLDIFAFSIWFIGEIAQLKCINMGRDATTQYLMTGTKYRL